MELCFISITCKHQIGIALIQLLVVISKCFVVYLYVSTFPVEIIIFCFCFCMFVLIWFMKGKRLFKSVNHFH